MLTLTALTSLILLGLAAKASAGRSPVAMTERGSAVLVWLAQNPRPGNRHSRSVVSSRARRKVWEGLRLAGVYYPFMCIHSHESRDWRIYNPPYAGGLQMDSSFQASYGPEYIRLWGHADPGHPGRR